MKDKFVDMLRRIADVNEVELEQISRTFKVIQVPARQHLTQIGEREKHLYFVVTGVLRLYCIDSKGEEATIFLFSENQFASSYSSFVTSKPSDQGLQTLEECTLLSIKKEEFINLEATSINMNVLTRRIADQRFINAQQVFMNHIMHTPEERYLQFEQNHSQLLLRVPQHIIASYLGITPVSLSRIRNRISKK
ncbi:Crp/Fnr family transcriptional regulator [Pontibacter sp. 13R65]|uniref:Crp/Fnr family transcriptional regulator n=1 Tax=Pontibacter sp. 13R65 TaxID=3127458 RepID=UPI00301C9FE6